MTTKELKKLLATQHKKGVLRCIICGCIIEPYQKLTIDHWLPKSRFPELAKNAKNLFPAHKICNEIKANLLPEEFDKVKVERFKHALEYYNLKYAEKRIIKKALEKMK